MVMTRASIASHIVAIWTATLTRLPALAVLALERSSLGAQFLSRHHELTIVHHLSFELHHHRHPLLVNVLQQVRKRVL